MNIKIIVHSAEEGGLWAESSVLPGCVSQGETLDELTPNMREAVAGWLEADPPTEVFEGSAFSTSPR